MMVVIIGMPASYCPSDCGVQNILADVMAPARPEVEDRATEEEGKKIESYTNENEVKVTEGYENLMHYKDFQRKLRRKMLRRKLKHRLL